MADLTEEERNRVAGELLAQIKEVMDRSGPLENGVPLPPDAQAEIELIRARAVVAGIVPERKA